MGDTNKRKKVKISKYDIIKVKVILDQHFFIFSRYILANILRVIKIPNKDAQKISSDLKKFLVENNLLNVHLTDFQKYAFEIMKKYNYDELFINRYRMMNQFYSKRFPLIILISGTNFIGKSTIATKLSERMNISNVLQTKIISDVMGFVNSDYSFKPFWTEENISSFDELIRLYEKESEIIRKGAHYDIIKGFSEGKALIIEGHHIIPRLYIKETSTGVHISTPVPEGSVETEKEKSTREEMNKIVQKGIIVPFLLTASEKDQLYLLKNNGLFVDGENILFNQDEEKSRIRMQNFLNKFKTIQNYLIGHSDGFIKLDVDLGNPSLLLDAMQDIILQKINESYLRGEF